MDSSASENRSIELAKKWLDGTITPEEEKEFAEWYNKDQDETTVPYSFASNSEELKQRILDKINAAKDGGGRKVIPLRRTTVIRRIAAAAIIILIASGAAWVITNSNTNKVSQEQIATNKQHTGKDALPGFNGAVLTLADGRTVILDSAGNGTIAQQSGTKIINQDGKISYQPLTTDHSPLIAYNTLTTPKGRTYSLELNDGTKVWLDAGSSIRYPVVFTGTERKVEITGQAWFDVVHNEKIPFKVMARGVEINDLGTEFNVNAYDDEEKIKVTLLKGAVAVKNVTLKPGQQAELINSQLTVKDDVDVEEVMAWKNGRFQFQDADIQTVMKEIGRWYDMEVVYEGAVPKDKFAGMISRYTNLSNVLKILNLSGVNYKIEGNKLTIQSK